MNRKAPMIGLPKYRHRIFMPFKSSRLFTGFLVCSNPGLALIKKSTLTDSNSFGLNVRKKSLDNRVIIKAFLMPMGSSRISVRGNRPGVTPIGPNPISAMPVVTESNNCGAGVRMPPG